MWNGSVYTAQLLCFMVIELIKGKTWFLKSSYYSRVFWLSLYIVHTWSDKAFKGTVVNQKLQYLHKRSLEITQFQSDSCLPIPQFGKSTENFTKKCAKQSFKNVHAVQRIQRTIFHCRLKQRDYKTKQKSCKLINL